MAQRMKTKRKNRIRKALTKLPKQIGVCRFIEFLNIEHPKVNGHFTHHPKFTKLQGLQIEHAFYYLAGENLKRVMINKRGAKILKAYSDVPEWAPQQLIEKYEANQNKES